MQLFTGRHAEKVRGVLSCLDRIVITGTIPGVCFPEGMTAYMYQQGIRIFDYPKWADGLREEVRANAEKVASQNGIEIEFIRKNTFRKEERIKKIPEKRGTLPAWSIFSPLWNPAPVTNLGMTRKPTRPSSNPTRASASIITFTSSLQT